MDDETIKIKNTNRKLKSIMDIGYSIEQEQSKARLYGALWTQKEANEVLSTGVSITKKSQKSGIPDITLDVKEAKQLLLSRRRIESDKITNTTRLIGIALGENNCALEGELVIDDKMFGLIQRLRVRDQNGIVKIKVKQEKINVIINNNV